jgi:hypothetical protein
LDVENMQELTADAVEGPSRATEAFAPQERCESKAEDLEKVPAQLFSRAA